MNLRDYLKAHKVTLRDFAASIGAGEDAVRKWVYGQRQPGLTDAVLIERQTGGLVTAADLLVEPLPPPISLAAE